jgi:hypothetical protein
MKGAQGKTRSHALFSGTAARTHASFYRQSKNRSTATKKEGSPLAAEKSFSKLMQHAVESLPLTQRRMWLDRGRPASLSVY